MKPIVSILQTLNSFIHKQLNDNRFISIDPEIRRSNKEVDDMIKDFYWNFEEFKF